MNKSLEKAKKKHFEFLRKNNAITDAKNGELSLGAMKSLDAILHVYQDTKDTKIKLELSVLRKKLGLEKNNDYVDRIKTYLLELKLPFELRDFHEHKTGKEVSFALTSFLNDVKSYKDTQHMVEINISENFIDYMIEKSGYTEIDLTLSKRFKTKYGYKIYEMYLRYYGLPNRVGKDVGTISKNIDELNEKFGTKHKYASKMLEGLERGTKEINDLTGEEIFCFYDKPSKKFVFSWAKILKKVESKCIIPNARVGEVVTWIIEHTSYPIKDLANYKRKIKKLVLNNEYDELEETYRGMLQFKYNYSYEEINALKTSTGLYKDFKKNEIQRALF
ncbi:MAG: replication initiation protein [Sulfurovum sp.]|nr:replication initiation protein [Sulfurovum sp.]